jgi:hypothetical protein
MSRTNKQRTTTPAFRLVVVEEAPVEIMDIEIDSYVMLRKQYINSEYIPIHIIPNIIKHYFKSAELLMSYSETHGLYKIKINDLLIENVKNWGYNRPPDMGRCPDIARYMYNSKKPIDTMFHLSFNNVKDVFEVLDGIHRITALKFIKDENSKPLDLLCSGEFGSGNDANWLFNQYMIVNIRFNSGEGELIEVFKNLNKSQTVPDLYIRDYNKERRDIIDAIANEWYVKYKKNFSSSENPITGNTNRNKFVDLLDKIYDKHKIDESNSNKLRELLNRANRQIADNIPSKVTVDTRVKCRETGCYLFLHKNAKLETLI